MDTNKENHHYIYILRCSDNSLYTGYTNNLEKRIKLHNDGKGSKYVRSRLPATMVYHEIFETKQEAMQRESEIKKWSRKLKISTFNISV